MVEDAVTAAPQTYRVLLENDRVRVLEVRSQPGDKTEMHSHPAAVAIAINDAGYRSTFADGQSVDIELKPGEAVFREAVEHSTEHIGPTEAHAVIVELK